MILKVAKLDILPPSLSSGSTALFSLAFMFSVLLNGISMFNCVPFSLNAPSTQSNFTLWNSHKAYMRGILIQLSSRLKKDRNKKLDDLFQLIKTL